MMKIFVYSSSVTKYKNNILCSIKPDDIVFCDSNCISRESAIYSNPNQWILFVDDDCIVEDDLFNHVKSIIQKSPNPRDLVYSGVYKNSNEANYIQRVHNFVANLWCQSSYANGSNYPYILGGIFLVHATDKKFSFDQKKQFWGAEDKLMSINLKDNGFVILRDESLQVTHLTNKSFLHFLKRAWLHGINEVKYLKKFNNVINYQFLIRNIGFANIHYVPLVGVHFFVQKLAILFQKVRQLSKL